MGCHRVDGSYPTLAPGGEVTGRLLETDDVPTLDRYERVADGLYVRVSIPFESTDTLSATTTSASAAIESGASFAVDRGVPRVSDPREVRL